jgi:hypothetical protein
MWGKIKNIFTEKIKSKKNQLKKSQSKNSAAVLSTTTLASSENSEVTTYQFFIKILPTSKPI